MSRLSSIRLTALIAVLASSPVLAQLPTLDFATALGSASQENGYAIDVGPDKNIFVAGAFIGTMDFDPGPGDATRTSAGQDDVFVAKYDPNGNFLNVWTFGGAGYDAVYYVDVDPYGGFYTAGEFEGSGDYDPGPGVYTLTSAGQVDLFMVHVNANGDLDYAYQWGGTQTESPGNFCMDRFGNGFLAGSYDVEPIDADPTSGVFMLPNATGTTEGFLVKINQDGSFGYGVSFSNASAVYMDAMTTDSAGNVYVVTEFINTLDVDPGPGVYNLSSPGFYSIALVELDPDGNFLDAGIMVQGTVNPCIGIPYDVDVDQHGDIYLTGYFYGTMDFDPGAGSLPYSASTRAIFVSKLHRDYSLVYAYSFGDGNLTNGANIESNSVGAAYFVGRFRGSVDFDPGPGVTTLTAASTYTPVVANFEPDGALDWAFTVDGCVDGSAFDLVLDHNNEIYVSGAFNGTGDFDPGPGVLNHTSAGMRDIWFAHYGVDTNVVTTPAPYVRDIVCSSNKAVGDPQYVYTVTFSEAVTGVDASDFRVSGTAPGVITKVTGSGATYQVTVEVGSLTGVIYLDLVDNDSIVSDSTSLPLGEAGLYNGDYSDAEPVLVSAKDIPAPASSHVGLLVLAGLLIAAAMRRVTPARA